MIVFTHHPSDAPARWLFDSRTCDASGSGRTLEGSMDNAEHAARQYLSRVQGYAVLAEDARHQVKHVVGDDESLSPALPYVPCRVPRFARPS